MKQFFYIWLAWFLYIAALVSIAGETTRYLTGDHDIVRALYVCIVASGFLTIWWRTIRKGK